VGLATVATELLFFHTETRLRTRIYGIVVRYRYDLRSLLISPLVEEAKDYGAFFLACEKQHNKHQPAHTPPPQPPTATRVQKQHDQQPATTAIRQDDALYYCLKKAIMNCTCTHSDIKNKKRNFQSLVFLQSATRDTSGIESIVTNNKLVYLVS
jgi:hypothetical protein